MIGALIFAGLAIFAAVLLVSISVGRGRVDKERAFMVNGSFYVGPEMYGLLAKSGQLAPPAPLYSGPITLAHSGVPIVKHKQLCGAHTGWDR